jgi:hypothetical protein
MSTASARETDNLLGGWIHRREGLAAGGIPRLTVDKELCPRKPMEIDIGGE